MGGGHVRREDDFLGRRCSIGQAGCAAALDRGHPGEPNRLAYAASKHAVVGLTTSMALDLAVWAFGSTPLRPGMIRTSMTEPMLQDPDNVKRIPAGTSHRSRGRTGGSRRDGLYFWPLCTRGLHLRVSGCYPGTSGQIMSALATLSAPLQVRSGAI